MSIIVTSVLAALTCLISMWICTFDAISRDTMCSLMMVVICLLPMRAITSKLILWAVEYYSSRDSDFRAKIRERWVTDPLDPNKKKFLNGGITAIGNTVIWLYWITVALLFWGVKPLAVYVINKMTYVLKSLKHLWGSPAEIMMFFIWFLLTVGLLAGIIFLYVILRRNATARKNGQAEPYNLAKCIKIFLAFLITRKLYTYIYYELSFIEVLMDVVVTVAIPFIYVLLELVIRRISRILNTVVT